MARDIAASQMKVDISTRRSLINEMRITAKEMKDMEEDIMNDSDLLSEDVIYISLKRHYDKLRECFDSLLN